MSSIAISASIPNATLVVEESQRPEFEIPAVNKETYRRILEAVEATGYNFVTAIRPVSINALLVGDGQRKSGRLGYVDASETIRAAVSPGMKVAINPNKFRIEGSDNLSTDVQKKMIKQEEAKWKSIAGRHKIFCEHAYGRSINTFAIGRCLYG